MIRESRELYADKKDHSISSSDECYLFQYELAKKRVDEAIEKGCTLKSLLQARDILEREIQLTKRIILEKNPVEKNVLREELPELHNELQEAQHRYNVEALRSGIVREDGSIDMPWLNLMNKSIEVIADEAKEEFAAIMQLQNKDVVARLLQIYCKRYYGNESLPIEFAAIAWKRLGNSELIRKHVQEEFRLNSDSLTDFGLSQEEAEKIREWIA